MENEFYSLCFLGKDNSGKEKAYEIMSMPVDKIDMYTSTWSDAKLLYHMLPSFKSKGIPCKDYLKEEFGITSDDDITNDNFFICKKGVYEAARIKNSDQIKITDSKKIPVLYRKDRDVVYLNKLLEEEKRALPEEIRKTNDEIHSSMLKFLMKQNEYFRSKKETYVNKKDEKEVKSLKEKRLFFEEVIKNIRKRNSNLLEIFELWRIRCLKDPKYTKKNSRGLTLCLSTSRNNIKLVSTEAQKDLILRRNLALLIKKTRREIDDINNKEFKTYLVPKYKLDKRQENNYEFGFNLETIRENIKQCLPIEIKKKYNIDDDFYDISDDLTPAEKYKDASKNQRTNIDPDAMEDYWGNYDLDSIPGLDEETFEQLNGISKNYGR